MIDDYRQLFQDNLKRYKESGRNGQFTALCHQHQDTKNSFSGNYITGLWNCKACGVKGNAYQFAEQVGLPEPHRYIEDNGVSYNYIPAPSKKPTISTEDLLSQMEGYKKNLKNNLDKFPDYWDVSLIDELGIGLDDNGNWVFGYYG